MVTPLSAAPSCESRLLHRSDRAVTLCKQPARSRAFNSFGALRMRLLLLLFCLVMAAPAAAAPFSADAYDACMNRIDASDERLFAAKPEEQAAARQESISVRAACVPQFEEWLAEPGLTDEDRKPITVSLAGMLAEITFFSADAGQCLQARGWLKRWRATPNFDETATEFVKTKAAVDKCGSQPQAPAVQPPAPQVTAPIIVNTTAAPLPVASRSSALRNWGYGLLGVGALAGVGGFLYNSAGAEDRDEYKTLTAACVAGTPSCDQARRITLATSIEDAKMPLLTIYGLAGVAALTGATFVTLDLMDEDDSRTTRLLLSPTAIQVAVRW